jgi:hypothetical protein
VANFAKDEGDFSSCAIISGNRMCKQCINQIMKLTSSYTKLISLLDQMSDRNEEVKCTTTNKERYRQYYGQAQMMWYTNNCDRESCSLLIFLFAIFAHMLQFVISLFTAMNRLLHGVIRGDEGRGGRILYGCQ